MSTNWNLWVWAARTRKERLHPCQFSLHSPWWSACIVIEANILNHGDKDKPVSAVEAERGFKGQGSSCRPRCGPTPTSKPSVEQNMSELQKVSAPTSQANIPNGCFFTSTFQILHENISGGPAKLELDKKGNSGKQLILIELTHYKITPVHSLSTCHPYASL